MILKPLVQTAAWRVHSPRWSFLPTSGAGAARAGGRFNRIGTEALYLSLDTQTALLEYQQTSTLLPPGLIAEYRIDLQPVADLSGGYVAAHWSPVWQDFACDWRFLWFNQHIVPPTWSMSDEAQRAGAKGILFPSSSNLVGLNLVIFNNAMTEKDSINVHDPNGLLPLNQRSWIP